MEIVKIAYEKYKLDWMISHGHTLEELMHELNIMQKEENSSTISSLYEDWEYGFGFGGEIWACYDEFIECEFFDIDYMKNILTKHEYDVYLAYVNENYTF